MDQLYKRIDALSATKSHKELVNALQPILNTLAYHAAQSDGAVMDVQEDWHGRCTDSLYEATGADVAETDPKGYISSGSDDDSSELSAKAHRKEHAPRKAKNRKSSRRDAYEKAAATRAATSRLTPSLQAIADGTHPTLRDDSD